MQAGTYDLPGPEMMVSPAPLCLYRWTDHRAPHTFWGPRDLDTNLFAIEVVPITNKDLKKRGQKRKQPY
jgi:hypothetical protein